MRSFYTIASYIFLALTLAFILFPIYVLIITSFKPFTEAFSYPPTLWPRNLTLEAYFKVFTHWGFTSYLINSLVITVSSVLLSVIVGIPMAYCLASIKVGKNWNENIAFFILSLRLLPPIVGILPLYVIYSHLKLVDTYPGLILAYTAFNLPFIVWILRGFILELPREIEESAVVDGASVFQIMIKIIVPLTYPAIIATAILSFLLTWNEFTTAVFLTAQYRKTLPILISSFIGDLQFYWNDMCAATVLSIIPAIIAVLLTQRQLVRGLTLGAVKG
ncbi:carbohydrate ABC transporter permease [Candidatus Bathyarchaeota archaeon]|nr:MAG: carbohydrate ABC transporter permease [Candidatus Wolframiiraptor sp.]RLI46868.1 MAG: carbohydrate ABC transporter permease [Candidatus Bathyarchaeota archaeon]